jgi:myo-inositol-1(or 4)-monophosphatase
MTLSYTELRQMLEAAVVAGRLSGQRAMEELRYVSRTVKNGGELVTQADPICQKIIIDRIRETYPDHGFLAEEGPEGNPLKWTPRGEMPIWWVIDPIDGTNNYANGLLCFSVSIAAFYEGRPVVAVVFDPATDSMFTAVKDGQTQLNTVRVTVNQDNIDKFAQFGIDSNANPRTDGAVRRLMGTCRIRSLGSTALHLAYVARGALIGAVTHSTRLWDIAAGILLIEEAGGCVTDLDGTPLPPIDLSDYDGKPCPILASNKKMHAELLALFKQ